MIKLQWFLFVAKHGLTSSFKHLNNDVYWTAYVLKQKLVRKLSIVILYYSTTTERLPKQRGHDGVADYNRG